MILFSKKAHLRCKCAWNVGRVTDMWKNVIAFLLYCICNTSQYTILKTYSFSNKYNLNIIFRCFSYWKLKNNPKEASVILRYNILVTSNGCVLTYYLYCVFIVYVQLKNTCTFRRKDEENQWIHYSYHVISSYNFLYFRLDIVKMVYDIRVYKWYKGWLWLCSMVNIVLH